MLIQTLILWSFEDDGFYKTLKVNAKTEKDAFKKLKEFLMETNYIIEHPTELDKRYDSFKLISVDVLDAVIL